MKKFIVVYRQEFEAEIEAMDKQEAIEKFQKGKCKVIPRYNLWNEFFEVFDEDGMEI